MCIGKVMLEGQFIKKLIKTEAELKKDVAYKKKRAHNKETQREPLLTYFIPLVSIPHKKIRKPQVF